MRPHGVGPDLKREAAAFLAAAAVLLAAGTAGADQVIADDLVVQGRSCIGSDCGDGEAFGEETLLLKENNLRILLDDTSARGEPREDWQVRANDSAAGGRSFFSIAELGSRGRVLGTAAPTALGADDEDVRAVAVADFNGDGVDDLVLGRYGLTNLLYLSNGTADPFAGVAPTPVGADAGNTTALLALDFNGDGLPDVVAGNYGEPNRLCLNNGTATPFNAVPGSNVTDDANLTTSLAAGDFNFDNRPDLVVGNYGEPNRFYLNNGTADPFAAVSGSNITDDAHLTTAVSVDWPGPFNSVVAVGNDGQPNRLYPATPGIDPFGGSSGTDISADSDATTGLLLADFTGDAILDVAAANRGQRSRLYLGDPGGGFTGGDLTAGARLTTAVVPFVLDEAAALGLVLTNDGKANRFFPGSGTAPPFGPGVDIDAAADRTVAGATGDLNGDGFADFVAGNTFGPTRVHLSRRDSTPFTVEAGAASDSVHVDGGGRVGIATATPDPGSALDVSGDLLVRGSLVAGGAQAGSIQARKLRAGRGRVSFDRPYEGDYVILLTAVARSAAAQFRPTVIRKSRRGFTFTIGGNRARLRKIQWATRIVGEY